MLFPPEIWDNRPCQAQKLSIRWLQAVVGSSCFVLILQKGFGDAVDDGGADWGVVPVMLCPLLQKDKCVCSFQMHGRAQP